jgi:hypothetical protein
MSTDARYDVQDFYVFMGKALDRKGPLPPPEQLLDEWRGKHSRDADEDADEEAILQALRSLEAGEEGLSIEEFDRQFRMKHGLPETP